MKKFLALSLALLLPCVPTILSAPGPTVAGDSANNWNRTEINANDSQEGVLLKQIWRSVITNPGPATAETKSAVTVTTSSALVLQTNAATLWADLTNTGAVTVWLSFGGTAATGSSFPLVAGQSYHLAGDTRFTGNITAIVASGTGTLAIQEHH